MKLTRLLPWLSPEPSASLTPVNTLDFPATSAAPARTGLAIGAIVKNEAPYIAEWLRFHEYAGVSHFFLYDDGSTDDTNRIALSTTTTAKVTLLPWAQRLRSRDAKVALNNQILAYGHCLANFGPQFHRMAFIDIDEFLVPLEHDTLPAALEDLDACPLVVLPWAMFGTSGHQTRPKQPTTQAFTRRLDPAAPEGVPGLFNFKCIFDPLAVTRLHVHRIRVNNGHKAWNDRGESFLLTSRTGPRQLSSERIQLNHYYSRSREDLDEKIRRGGGTYTDRGAHDAERLRARVAYIDDNSIEDTAIGSFIARHDAKTGRSFYDELPASAD